MVSATKALANYHPFNSLDTLVYLESWVCCAVPPAFAADFAAADTFAVAVAAFAVAAFAVAADSFHFVCIGCRLLAPSDLVACCYRTSERYKRLMQLGVSLEMLLEQPLRIIYS